MSSHINRTIRVLDEEPELGPQRQCRVCGDWWPDDDEFWYSRTRKTGRPLVCRACWNSRYQECSTTQADGRVEGCAA